MHIAYFDESGDDGFPSYSSPLFALSASYLHYLNWKPAFEQILEFRRELKKTLGVPVKLEIHAKYFLLNKNPYKQFGFSDADRIRAISAFCDLIASLELKLVNAVIVKPRVLARDYNVLDWALKMSIQRIENDLDPGRNPTARFLMITDEGRVGKMRATARRMQRINFIPSKFGTGTYRREIQSLIEDPLPKDSRDSYFIQLSDLVAFVVYLHCLVETGVAPFSNRLATLVDAAQVRSWMDQLKPRFNLLASSANPYGIVIHPNK
jgi:Protein of unknown function (DUF3800)